MPIFLRPAHSVPKMPTSITPSLTVAERALFLMALGPANICLQEGQLNITGKFEAGLDEVKNSVGMNHAPRNIRLIESSCGT
jgi:hypothetical protein